MIQGILKALAGQGGAAFTKGVADGYNQDVKAKQLQEYELAKELADKDPEDPDKTKLLFTVGSGPLQGQVVNMQNPSKEVYSTAGERARNRLSKIFTITTENQPEGIYKWNEGDLKGINNWTEYLHQYSEKKAINKLLMTTSGNVDSLFNIAGKGTSGKTNIPSIDYPKQNKLWNTMIPMMLKNKSKYIYRDEKNFIKAMEEKQTNKDSDIVFVDASGGGSGFTMDSVMPKVRLPTGKFNPNGSQVLAPASAKEFYSWIFEYGRNKGFMAQANTQEEFRDKTLASIVNMASRGRTAGGLEVGQDFKVTDFIQHSMVFQKIFADGFVDVDSGQIAQYNNYVENHVDGSIKDNPMLMIELLGTAFSKNSSINDKYYGDDIEGFEKFVKTGLRIKDVSQYKKAISNVTKPLERAGGMITALDSMSKDDEFPLGGPSKIGLFFDALGDIPKMFGTLLKGDLAGSEIFSSTLNRLDRSESFEQQGFNVALRKDHEMLSTNLNKADEKAKSSGKSEDINAAKLAIMEYDTYLLAFEMAAAVQGGGDSRTISDKDVRIMQKALMLKFFTSADAFRGVLVRVQDDLQRLRDRAGIVDKVIGTLNIQTAKAYGIFERAGLSDKYFTTLAKDYYDGALGGYQAAGDKVSKIDIRTEPYIPKAGDETTYSQPNNTDLYTEQQTANIIKFQGQNTKVDYMTVDSIQAVSNQDVINDVAKVYSNNSPEIDLYAKMEKDDYKTIKKLEKMASNFKGGISGGFDEYITGSFGLKSFTAHVLKEGYKMMTDAKYEPKKYQGEK